MTLCGPLGSSCAGQSPTFWTWATISFPKLQKPLVIFSNISSDPLSHTSSGTPFNANIRALNIAPEVFSIIPISFHSLQYSGRDFQYSGRDFHSSAFQLTDSFLCIIQSAVDSS